MNHRKMLIGLMSGFFILWFAIPLVLPQSSRLIGMITMPIRHLGIYVHEMGHGLFTLLSGGRFHWFQMELMQGGVAITSGGIRQVTLLGGLLGPAFFGALLLQASTRVKNLVPILWGLIAFFVIGLFYMFKPLFLSEASYPHLANWNMFLLISAFIPGGAALVTYKIRKLSDKGQRIYLQVMGIFMCYSGFSDTHYIFRYEPLGNGLYSDARVVASTFWPSVESVPFWLFVITAVFISAMNFGLMIWGVHRALKEKQATT